ncbi:MAG: exodeoxyribonuclease VII small subunit [Hahellaceae bacterium]|nr:exodeoxyribonuclease VII small subunit [Hahellaceae bacterium]MCP5210820.1 exodeoxyribonuclease VII small subunit [Hahellaceae bacterium]
MKKKNASDFNFESALGELENIVKTMEQGELTLEKSLSAYEEGIKLSKECQKALQIAEQRVMLIQENDAELVKTPFLEATND